MMNPYMETQAVLPKVKKINVLHLLSSFGSGGIERLMVDMVKAIPAGGPGIDITVAVMNSFVDEALKSELMKYCSRVYFLNRQQGHFSLKYFVEIFKVIRKHNIKILHAHNYGSKIWASVFRLMLPGVRLFFTTHDTLFKLRGINKVSLFLHRYVADCNIAVSGAVLELIKGYRFKNPCLIYNGIDLDKFKPADEPFRQIESPIRSINVARVEHAVKGQDILLKAIKLLADRGCSISCTFAGPADGRFRESCGYLSQLAEELGLAGQITFLGNREDIPDLLQKHDVFVLPSRYEGLGLSILEAMASGVPVVASNLDGPSELIRPGINGLLFESGNAEDLAQKIHELYSSPTLQEHIRKNGIEFVRNFDIIYMCRKYEEIYRSSI